MPEQNALNALYHNLRNYCFLSAENYTIIGYRTKLTPLPALCSCPIHKGSALEPVRSGIKIMGGGDEGLGHLPPHL